MFSNSDKNSNTFSPLSAIKRFFKGHNSNLNTIEQNYTPLKLILKKMLNNKLAIVGAIGLIFVFLLCFLGSALLPLNENYSQITHANLRPDINYLNYPQELKNEHIVRISSGISYSAAITSSGKLYLWGSEPNKNQENVSTNIFDVPLDVENANIVDIACGANHIVVADDSGNLYSWGYDGNGQTQIPSNIANVFSGGTTKIIKIVAMSSYTAILGSDNNIYIWGSTQAENTLLLPSSVKGRIVNFAASDTNIALVLDDGTVEVIGDRGTEFATLLPEELTDKSVNIVDIQSTQHNVLALDNDGNLYTWGSAQNNLANIPAFESDIVSIKSGYDNFVALTKDGNVTVWGSEHLNALDVPNNMQDIQSIHADNYQFYAQDENSNIYAWGNKGYLFGTDHFGRDIFLRIIHGGRISLTVGAIAVIISVLIAMFVGLTAGYFGGAVDHILMRITDVFSSIPFFPIAITLSYIVGHSLTQEQKIYMIMVILGVLSWMSLARLIRAQLLIEREKDFVLAARALGLKNNTIMLKHILPNIFNLVIVNITLGYASSLLAEAALSFLGLGVTEPTPSWGNMLMAAQDISVIQFYWWRWLIPALFVIFTALCTNLIGDGLREAMDPRNSE